MTSAEHAEIKRLKAENRRLREDVEILKAATLFLRGRTRLPQPLIMAFIDDMRAQGHAVESTCQGAHRARLPGRRADLPVLAIGQPSRCRS